jgi:transposase
VRSQFLSLLKRVEALEARVNRDSSNSSRPPSTDAPAKKRQRRMQAAERGFVARMDGKKKRSLEPRFQLTA